MELRIESAEIWYHNCTFSMRNKRQIWIHLVSYVHIHHHIESVHKIAIDAICSKNSILPSFFLFAAPTIMEKFKWLHFFSCLLFIMNLNRFFMYAQVSLIDGKFITIETIRYGKKEGMEKNSIILFFVNALSIFAKNFSSYRINDLKNSHLLNFFRLLWPFLFFCRYYVSVSICGRAWKIFHLCTFMYKTVGRVGRFFAI